MSAHMSFDGSPGRPQHVPPTVLSRPVEPVFVDATGVRHRWLRRAGVLVAAASLSYLPMAATALLPGPPTPTQPAPLSVGDPAGGTGEHPPTEPPPLGDPDLNLTPEPEDTMDGPPLPTEPAPDAVAPTAMPSIDPPAPSHPTTVPPTGRPSATPMPPTSRPPTTPVAPTSPPAPLPEDPPPPVTDSPTMSTPVEPSPEPVENRPITSGLAPWVTG
ncbi:hypothetical protein ABZ780_20220 [Micromonospora sp. NPDC047467]|uniref:hypothetical protein n=1 Tax=Micromonospora sp. NPDC047467 TaxID=3154814 RepID=UPI0033F0195C